MIDDLDIKELNKLHPRNTKIACLSPSGKGLVAVHSPYFVLEVPADQVRATGWQHEPYAGVREWRQNNVPQSEGEAAQVMRTTWEDPDEGSLEVIQLMSENVEQFMRPAFYDFFTSVLTQPSFRLYKEKDRIGIFDEDKLVGVLTPLRKAEGGE